MNKSFFFVLTLFVALISPQASILHAQIDEPQKPYNFYNYGPDGKQYCWLLSELQCLYRIKPIHDLLDMLDQNKSRTQESFKVSQVLKRVFSDMRDELKFNGAQRYFPEILRQIGRDAAVQKMLDAGIQARTDKVADWNNKKDAGGLRPEELHQYYRDIVRQSKYQIIKENLKDFREPDAGVPGVSLFFIKNINRAFPKQKMREYLDLIPFSQVYFHKFYLIPYYFTSKKKDVHLPKSLIFFNDATTLSATDWYEESDYPKGFTQYQSASEKIIIQGKSYELVAMVLIGSPNLEPHQFALVKYGGSWYKYDSFYGGKDPEPLHGSLPDILEAQRKFKNGNNWSYIFFYQEIHDLSSQLEKLKYALEELKDKLVRLKKQLEELKGKLIA